MEMILAYALLGAFAGVLAGLLGVGGGLVIVPVLVMLWQAGGLGGSQTVQLAVGTSLAVIMLTSLSSVRAHHVRGGVVWSVFWRLTPGILLGAVLGAALATTMPQAMLKRVFGIFELLVAAQLAFSLRPPTSDSARRLPGSLAMGLAGMVIGAVSALVGIGGGTMTVPFLDVCRLRMQQAVGTSAACGLPIAVGGTLSYVWLGWGIEQLPVASAGFVYGPALAGIAVTSVLFAPLGAALAHRLPTVVLKKMFAGFLALLGVWMLIS
ncbi:MAG TPA: sulfite exporter TauE/SafE family protein [Gammaproteobacteria bacterium]|nr:sulfite exporter TauE/SafE family protein [Gammaproteobacteria bacterium]